MAGRCEYPRSEAAQCRQTCTANPECNDPTSCEAAGTGRCVDNGCVYTAIANGATCAQADSTGVCFDGQCIDCLTTSDCDPRGFGRDLCYRGMCSNRTCSFTEIVPCERDPLGTGCEDDDDCRTGYCSNGVCCESRCDGVCVACGGDGRCDEMPDDDDACGTIDCDELDTVCRNYHDLDEGGRCAAPGVCVQPNSDACDDYSNASNSTTCRPVAGDCDVLERCLQGVCPSDVVDPAGQTCSDGGNTNTGRCDGSSGACRELPQVSYGARWFMEEVTYAQNRQDAFGTLPLAYSGTGDLTRVEGPSGTGAGVYWPTTSSPSIYCTDVEDVPLSPDVAELTFEAVITAANQNSAESTVLMLGPTSSRAKLSVIRNSADPVGAVRIRGTFGDTAAYYTWAATVGERTVLHLTFNGAEAGANTAMRLYVNGVEVAPQATSTVADHLTVLDTDELCLGNDQVGNSGAFLGTIWYGAVYTEVLGIEAIRGAASRLSFADKP